MNETPDSEEQDALWRLLGQAPLPPQPDPWFTARTIARCRYEVAEARHWLGLAWRWALGSGLSVALAVFLFVPHLSFLNGAVSQKQKAQEAFEVMASLGSDADTTTPSSSSATWQDSTSL